MDLNVYVSCLEYFINEVSTSLPHPIHPLTFSQFVSSLFCDEEWKRKFCTAWDSDTRDTSAYQLSNGMEKLLQNIVV